MRNRRLALSLIAAMVCGTLLSLVGHAQADPASRALDYLRSTQQADGSIPAGSFGGYSASEWYVIASAGNGFDPNAMNNGGASAVAYLEQHAAAASSGAAQAGLLAQAFVAAAVDPRNVSGVDVISAITSTYHASPTSTAGAFDDGSTYTQALAITGLRAAGVAVVSNAYSYLEGLQDSDGGWNYLSSANATSSDTNSTAMAVMALAGDSSVAAQAAIGRAVTYLHSQQEPDGGFGYQLAWGTDADSTSLVIQAVVATGQDPAAAEWTRNGASGYASLLTQQDSAGGFGYQGAAPDSYTSAQAVFGLERQPFPASHVYAHCYGTMAGDSDARHALAYLETQLSDRGALPDFSGNDDPSSTSDMVISAATAGVDPATLTNGHTGALSALQYLKSVGVSVDVTSSAGRLGKLIEAAVASGADPTAFGGHNLVDELNILYGHSIADAYGDGETTSQALALLGLEAAHQSVPGAALTYLQNLRDGDGGWNFTATSTPAGSDTNSTAVALMALDGAGVHSDDASAVTWIRDQQESDAGFGYQKAWGTDVDSTSLVIQALIAAGQNPASAAFTVADATPVITLASAQDTSGGFGYQGAPSDPFTTSQVVAGLLRASFPARASFAAGSTASYTSSGCAGPAPSPTGTPTATPSPTPVGGIDSAIHVTKATPTTEPSATASPTASPTPATEVPKTGAESGAAALATVTSAAHPDDSNWMVYLVAALCAMAIVVVASLVVRGRRA